MLQCKRDYKYSRRESLTLDDEYKLYTFKNLFKQINDI